jgi:hypothetical protein
MTRTGSTQHVSQLLEDSKHNAHKKQCVFSIESLEAGLIVMERDNLTLASFVDFCQEYGVVLVMWRSIAFYCLHFHLVL